jgi:hypothetical protein
MNETPRHKVFISFHHDDQYYKDSFVEMMGDDIVDQSVEDGDIDDENLSTATIRQKIRDEFVREATVTVVLIGHCTWQRKHVDWEIGSSLRDTKKNSRCGLLGILLPNHGNHGSEQYNPLLIPPRLADNCDGSDPYSLIYDWSYNSSRVRRWIHEAFQRRTGPHPDNSRTQFKRNRSGVCSDGWTD